MTSKETINPLTLKKGSKGAFDGDPFKPFAKTSWVGKRKDDFHWIYSDEPHTTRRKEILKAHPEIRKLFGTEILTFYIVSALTLSQIWICSWIGGMPWYIFFAVMYLYGGTVNHTLQLANHEISHNLVFETPEFNLLLGIFANIVTGVPSSVTFRMYHIDHHQYQGFAQTDTDIPCEWELRTFTTTFRKFIWVIGQVFAYALRPIVVKPKPINRYQILNGAIQIAFDYFVLKTLGWEALAYLVGGSLIGLGLHPAAGHFIAEHYEFVKGFETYSYYGPLNYVNFNVGYHNEHHDFPKIPWSRLPLVHQYAPEWYEHLPRHHSYLRVIYQYIFDDQIGPWSRVKRPDNIRSEKKRS